MPVATVGAILSEDFIIGERKMAGMTSRGMICAEDEIGLVCERAAGIMILEDFWDEDHLESKIGDSVFSLEMDFPGIDGKITKIPLQDTTFEIDNKFITNRPDLFSIIGNAREWAAVFQRDYTHVIKTPRARLAEANFPVRIDSDACLAYSLLETDGITTAQSPLVIRMMMERAGLKPKLDIVDITNLLLTEYGQPMHAFDADKIVGGITVRSARPGETLLALNNETYTLTEQDLVIADDRGAIAIAGVIGGLETAVSETTTRVLWESATFEATSIRLTAQRLGIRTDASTRYEKSLDPHLTTQVFGRVLEYLDFMGKTPEIMSHFEYIHPRFLEETVISLPLALVYQKAGQYISDDTIESILTKLGFEILDRIPSRQDSIALQLVKRTLMIDGGDDELMIRVPSWRATKDISIPEDLVEEILRIYGYDHIPAIPFDEILPIREKNQEKHLHTLLLQFFANNGWTEVYNYSFTNLALQSDACLDNHESLIAIQNAYTEDFTHMRSSLAPRLFANIRNNIRHQENLQFFEIGNIYGKHLTSTSALQSLLASQSSRPYTEKRMLAGVSTQSDIANIRNNLESLYMQLCNKMPVIKQGSDAPFLHPGICGEYTTSTGVLARFGRIHPQVAIAFEIPENTVYFEIDMEHLFLLSRESQKVFQPISPYQPIRRELNFLLPRQEETGKVARHIAAVHPWISEVVVASIYEDAEKIGSEKKSVTFAFVVQSPESTITDEQAKHIQDAVIDTITRLGYPLRGL